VTGYDQRDLLSVLQDSEGETADFTVFERHGYDTSLIVFLAAYIDLIRQDLIATPNGEMGYEIGPDGRVCWKSVPLTITPKGQELLRGTIRVTKPIGPEAMSFGQFRKVLKALHVSGS
jgi:hypothetical protein